MRFNLVTSFKIFLRERRSGEAVQGVKQGGGGVFPRKVAKPEALHGLYSGCCLLGTGRGVLRPRAQQEADRPG